MICIPSKFNESSSSCKSELCDCTMNSLPSLYSDRPSFSHGPAGGDSVRGSNFPNGECISPEVSLIG